jgi:F0F1-type ATP synthase assembly protein I
MVDTEMSPSSSLSTAPASSSTGSNSDGAYQLILKVAGVVGTGIGVLGFVTFFGGAILWLRSNEADLPASDAIAAVPRNVLVTTGAEFLVPAVLLALLGVSCLFTVHLAFAGWRKLKRGNEFMEGQQLLKQAEVLQHAGEKLAREAQPDRDFAVSLAKSAELAAQAGVETQRERLAEEAASASGQADKKKKAARDKLVEAAQKEGEANEKMEKAKAAFGKQELITEYIAGGLVLLVLPTAFYPTLFHLPVGLHTLILIGVALAVVAVSLAIYLATERFVWFGVAAFVMIGVYLGFVTYYATTNNPKAEPAAAIRANHPPVAGMYIAETSSNLYLGTFPEQEQPARLMVIPKEQITDLTIGPLLDPDRARQRAIGLARQECAMKITIPETETEPKKVEEACSQEELATLEAGLRG